MPPLSVDQVLDAEYEFLHGKSARVADVLKRHQDAGHSALCLSGGGVRSASFALGVLQGLARAGLLDTFDYLSTVSGGGYIGGWLSAWRLRARENGERSPAEEMGTTVEPDIIRRLGYTIKYLDPRAGVLSTDVWTLGATLFRNLLVTWLVLVPLIACGALLPRLYLGVLGLVSLTTIVSWDTLMWWYQYDWAPIFVLILASTLYAALELPSLGNKSRGTRSFIACFLVPVLLVHFMFSIHRFWSVDFGLDTSLSIEVTTSGVGMMLPWLMGALLSPRKFRPWTWTAAAAAGVLGRLVTSLIHQFLATQAHYRPELFTVIDLPISLVLLFLEFSLFVGLASRDMTDEDREWWARAGAWILMSAIVWLAVSAVTVLGPMALMWVVHKAGVSDGAGRSAAGVLTVLSGASAYGAGASQLFSATGPKWLKNALIALAAPVSAVLLVVLVAEGDTWLLTRLHDVNLFHEVPHPVGASLPEDLVVLGGLALVAFVLGRIISVNQFSLHDMYRARLVRTFLGISRPFADRRPSRFTGFDTNDDLKIDTLKTNGRPLHVVNATLNLVADKRLATAEVKSAPFTTTALHAGSRDVGYRPSPEYGGGVTLGRAITTSGAAVSPNMGAGSSPVLTFLLTVLNARLGVWLGNPGTPGEKTWTRAAPAVGVGTLVNELLGRTTDTNPYVYLSDGGHFENLGLYEMIARRCRFIIVSDAGADGQYVFADLANAMRLVHLDFGVAIDFPSGMHVGAAGSGTAHFAVGVIRYSANNPGDEDGTLIYLKPAMTGDEPVDVINYAKTHEEFPQEPTADQWFDMPQFESYRELGFHTVLALGGGRQFASVKQLCQAVREGAA